MSVRCLSHRKPDVQDTRHDPSVDTGSSEFVTVPDKDEDESSECADHSNSEGEPRSVISDSETEAEERRDERHGEEWQEDRFMADLG